jgi:hypothetical protein
VHTCQTGQKRMAGGADLGDNFKKVKHMISILFLPIGLLFFWMVCNAWFSREIKGRGWGFGVRTYQRDSEPIWYWVTFSSYLVCAVWATTFGILAAIHMV